MSEFECTHMLKFKPETKLIINYRSCSKNGTGVKGLSSTSYWRTYSL